MSRNHQTTTATAMTASNKRMSTPRAVVSIWLADLGISRNSYTLNDNGDVTIGATTLTREQMISGGFGTAGKRLAEFVDANLDWEYAE